MARHPSIRPGLVGRCLAVLFLGLLTACGFAQTALEAAKPVLPAPPAQAIQFRWDTYRTLLVIGDGVGTIRPAWVATYERPKADALNAPGVGTVLGLFGYAPMPETDRLVVAYRAQAFQDAEGVLHLDARKAVIAGPQADAWSPDSFALHANGEMATEDDNGNGNAGTVLLRVFQAADPETYRKLLTEARIAAGGDI